VVWEINNNETTAAAAKDDKTTAADKGKSKDKPAAPVVVAEAKVTVSAKASKGDEKEVSVVVRCVFVCHVVCCWSCVRCNAGTRG
jgi:hypothetical protein